MDMLGSVAKGTTVADGIKFASQLTLKSGDYPGLSRLVQCNHRLP